MIGQTISHYQILRELGAGGMGVVYLANDTVLKRRVAVKMLNAKYFARGNQKYFRLLNEARAVSRINHPNVATVYDYGETEQGQPFIVMEYVDGDPLYRLIQRRALSVEQTLEIIGLVAEGVSEAHRLGVIHRDLKPSNIVIGERQEVKVLDFGLAKQTEDATLSPDGSTEVYVPHTPDGSVIIGTPLYLSPEQATGAPVDERSDIFSLGSVFYECLTGRSPFYAQSSVEIYARILRDDPIAPSNFNPAISSEIDQIVLKALAKDPIQRYQSAKEFRKELIGISSKAGHQLPPTTQPSDGHKTDPADLASTIRDSRPRHTEPTSVYEQFHETWSRNSVFLKTAGGLLLIALTGLLFYFGYRAIQNKQTTKATSLQFQRLPISGNVKLATLSPDGKYVASVIEQGGKDTIQLTELATSSEMHIAAPSETGYTGLTFSPDNNYLYYLENEVGDQTPTLYRVSKLGGNNRKIMGNVGTAVTFSPDGSHLSFIRYQKGDASTQLIVASKEGTDERVLATRKSPHNYSVDRAAGPVWSPLNDVIACSTLERTQQGFLSRIEMVDVQNGSSKFISKQNWYQIKKLSWLASGKGLIIAGTSNTSKPLQLVLLSYPDDQVNQITTDPNDYSTISSTADSSRLLTIKQELNSTVWVMPINAPSKATAMTMSQNKGVAGIAWLTDTNFIYVAPGMDGFSIWSENSSDGKRTQLTFAGSNYEPTISSDKRYIVFVSNRSGTLNIWRMNVDGTNQLALTQGKYEDQPQMTPDGKSVVYHAAEKEAKIWKVPIDGGAPVSLISQEALYPAVSPDGKMLAAFVWGDSANLEFGLSVFSLDNGTLIKRFALPQTVKAETNKLRWTPDGRGLVFINDDSGVANLWIQDYEGTTPRPLTRFAESRLLFDFAWSPNGQQLACVRGDIISSVILITGLEDAAMTH